MAILPGIVAFYEHHCFFPNIFAPALLCVPATPFNENLPIGSSPYYCVSKPQFLGIPTSLHLSLRTEHSSQQHSSTASQLSHLPFF